MKPIFVFFLLTILLFLNNCESNGVLSQKSIAVPVAELSPTPAVNNQTNSEPPPIPPQEPEKKPLEYANDQDKFLFEAVGQNNVAQVQKSLEQGANANAKAKTFDCAAGEPTFTSVLGKAIEERNTEIARLLLERGADVNNYFSCGNYVSLNFPRAVVNQDLPMMKLLVEYGAETGKNTNDNQILISAKKKEVLDYLIEIGFDINSRDRVHGFTPLFLAVRSNDLNLVKAILNHKPNLEVVTEPTKINGDQELTILQLAQGIGNEQIIQALKKAGAKK